MRYRCWPLLTGTLMAHDLDSPGSIPPRPVSAGKTAADTQPHRLSGPAVAGLPFAESRSRNGPTRCPSWAVCRNRLSAVHGVPGAPAGPGAGDVAGCLQVGHDGLDGAFGEAGGGAMSRIRAVGLRAISTSTCPCPVSSVQLPPRSSGAVMTTDISSRDHPREKFSWDIFSREKSREIFLMFLLTGLRCWTILVVPDRSRPDCGSGPRRPWRRRLRRTGGDADA